MPSAKARGIERGGVDFAEQPFCRCVVTPPRFAVELARSAQARLRKRPSPSRESWNPWRAQNPPLPQPEKLPHRGRCRLRVLLVGGRQRPRRAGAHDQHGVADFDAGRAVDAGVDVDLRHLGERHLERLDAQNRSLRCITALPASLSRVSLVEPDCRTRRCGALSTILAMAVPLDRCRSTFGFSGNRM